MINKNINKIPNNSIIFEVNFDEESELKKKFNVFSQTMILFFNSKGELIDRKINPKLERTIKSLKGESSNFIKKSNDNNFQQIKTMPNNNLTGIDSKIINNDNYELSNFKDTADQYAYFLKDKNLKSATFAGGCFWCIEAPLEAQLGVVEVFSGFSGGDQKNPSYNQVSKGETNHREAVQIFYNPKQTNYNQLLEIFWRQIDPTDAGGQFADRGDHYTTAIFYNNAEEKETAEKSKIKIQESNNFKDSIVTEIELFKNFYLAEENHQNFYKKQSSYYKKYKNNSGRTDFIDSADKNYNEIFNSNTNPDNTNILSNQEIEDMRAKLDPLSFDVIANSGTETPFDNAFWDHKLPGIYVDKITGEALFSSTDKYQSGTGWPSFTRAIDETLEEVIDDSLFTTRTEVRSKQGNSHLGHVFNDGPIEEGGKRYCINSAALNFIPANELKAKGYDKYLKLFN